ncbi:MAG TPA: adenylosuccinate lyase [bacterium]|nr:adenylosuccinate lyase [bacterium]
MGGEKIKMAVHPIDYRYGSREMREIFEERRRLKYQLMVEGVLAETLAEFGKIPKKQAGIIKKRANLRYVKLERVKEIEKETRHDVVAMLKALGEVCGRASKYIHLTATSYDIVDTALALQVKDGLNLLLKKGKIALNSCLGFSQRYKKLVVIGRTHGQHALPITLGFKFASFADKLGEDLFRLKEDKKYLQGKFSGAVGTYASQKILGLNQNFEKAIMKKLNLTPADISTQVVPRENLARIICDIAVLAGTTEQIAKEIRNLQRTEIAELAEPFGKNQVGSSAMPQKRNPWESENICSNVKIVRSCVFPALENIALEHERDLTNSAAERSVLPTVFILMDDILGRLARILKNLVVFPENIKRNLELTGGKVLAEAVLTELTKRGMPRLASHQLLREISRKKNFREELFKNKEIARYISQKELKKIMDYKNYIGFSVEKTEKIIKKWKNFSP